VIRATAERTRTAEAFRAYNRYLMVKLAVPGAR